MRPERYTYHYDRPEGRGGLRRRIVFVLLVLLALVLLVLSRTHNERLLAIRTQITDFLSPVVQAVTWPVRKTHDWMADKDALLEAHHENSQLREENENLRQWESVAKMLKAENENLRALAGYKPVETMHYVTAQVIGQSPSAYAGKLLINVGSVQGVTSLAPVIDAYGLIGRTIEVGENSAHVLLLSDPASRIPVITADSRRRAILTGTGDALLQMSFIDGDAKDITLGESVMSTAQGGLMPESVVVGTIFRREADGELLVKPLRPLAEGEYVRVMVEH